jgi:Zn-dependent peptidase ImmA (M78 family)
MQFEIISLEVLKRCLSNLLMRDYKKSYSEFRKFAKLEISEKEFEEFKKREITDKEIREIVLRKKIDSASEVERLKAIWDEKEEEIIKVVKEITGLDIETKDIICDVDPYQNGGYFGESNITVGAYKNPEDVLFVITHELFHVFYWKNLAKLNLTNSTMGKEKLSEWEIAEATAHLLTTEQKLRKFWPTIAIEPYPEIEETLKKVENIWRTNSFEDYLSKAYELIVK